MSWKQRGQESKQPRAHIEAGAAVWARNERSAQKTLHISEIDGLLLLLPDRVALF